MGWTSEPVRYWTKKNGKRVADRKQHVHDIVCAGGRYEILTEALYGSTWYGAIREKPEDACGIAMPSSPVFACIILTHVREGMFSYKIMDEAMGPCYYDCPAHVLKILSPTDNAYALEWRRACTEKRKAKRDPGRPANLSIGTMIEIDTKDGPKRYTKMAPMYQFKTPFWMAEDCCSYLPKNRIPKNFRVVAAWPGEKRTEVRPCTY